MEENDKKIKELFHKDQFISKKADDLFNDFLKEEINMNKESKSNVKKMSIWKRAIATAACLVIIFGGANIYASTQGYGNVFFLIKYLVTGEKVEIVDKNALLSDRDMVISYEPIQLTENIRIQVRRLQIKDNKAVLSVVVKEDSDANDVVPLKYVVNNSKGDIICEQTSKREINGSEYCDELQLSSLYESDTKISLSIYNNASQQLVKLIIDLNSKTISVEGAEEAISKISEVELKRFLDIVSTYQHITKENDNLDAKTRKIDIDNRINLAITFLKKYNTAISSDSYSAKVDSNTEGYKVEAINKVLRELGYRPVDNYDGNKFKKVSYQGNEYFTSNQINLDTNTCLEIVNLSYAAGIYKVEYTYTNISGVDTFETKIDESNINKAALFFKTNDNNEYSRYTITQFNSSNPEITEIEPVNQEVNVNEENNSNNQTNNNNNNSDITTNNNSTPTNNPSNTNSTSIDISKVDNYASSLNWREYNAPGLRIQYPTLMRVKTIETMYKGSDVTAEDAKSVEFEGELIGKDVDTQKVVKSNTKITVYMPEYVSETTEIDYYAHAKELIFHEPVDFSVIPGGPAGFTSKNGDNWSESSITKDGKYYELYTCYKADVGYGYKILFETDNIENYKVRNVINWFLGNLKFTSF